MIPWTGHVECCVLLYRKDYILGNEKDNNEAKDEIRYMTAENKGGISGNAHYNVGEKGKKVTVEVGMNK